MKEISLHILDIVQNSLAAQARFVRVLINEQVDDNRMFIEIEDDGKGMSEEQLQIVLDPFFTTRTTRKVGMGLSLLLANAQACGGDLKINSVLGKGTLVMAEFEYNHIDRQPLGDMVLTLQTILSGSPEIRLLYQHHYNEREYVFDTDEIKKVLEGVPFNHPHVLRWIGDYLTEKENYLYGSDTTNF